MVTEGIFCHHLFLLLMVCCPLKWMFLGLSLFVELGDSTRRNIVLLSRINKAVWDTCLVI